MFSPLKLLLQNKILKLFHANLILTIISNMQGLKNYFSVLQRAKCKCFYNEVGPYILARPSNIVLDRLGFQYSLVLFSCVCIYICVCVCARSCVYIYICTYVYTHIYVCVHCVYIHIYVYMCVCKQWRIYIIKIGVSIY